MRAASAFIIIAIAIWATNFVQAQPQGGQRGGASLADRFRQYDKNGDGKVTLEEAGQMPMFDQWDANKDGAVMLEEVEAFYAKRGAGGGAAKTPPAGPKTGTEPAPARVSRQDFVPDAPFVGQVNGSYGDPEFSEAASQVVFQDSQNRLWIGDIDSETGMFKTATGCDYLMDEKITLIFDRPPQGRKFSTNGPEWTQDDMGSCVVYTKEDAAGIMQQWMARLVDGKSVVTQLTHNKLDSYGNMPSRFVDGKPPRIAYTYGRNLNGGLRYAAYDGAAWQIETLENSDTAYVARYCSLALDFAGHARISYQDLDEHYLKYALQVYPYTGFLPVVLRNQP